MRELCQRFGISRKTGYKVLAKHAEHGLSGLKDGSRAPRSHPNQTEPEVEGVILRVRKAHRPGARRSSCGRSSASDLMPTGLRVARSTRSCVDLGA